MGVGRGRFSHVSGLSVSDMSSAFCQSVWMALHPLSPPTHVLTLASLSRLDMEVSE